MAKRKKIRAGDVFRFSDGADGYGYGQVIISDILQYVVIFAPRFFDDQAVDQALASPVLLSGWTMDAWFRRGDWEIVATRRPIELCLPTYKVGVEGRMWLTNFAGALIRPATPREAEELTYFSSHSPGVYVDAFKAHHALPNERY